MSVYITVQDSERQTRDGKQSRSAIFISQSEAATGWPINAYGIYIITSWGLRDIFHRRLERIIKCRYFLKLTTPSSKRYRRAIRLVIIMISVTVRSRSSKTPEIVLSCRKFVVFHVIVLYKLLFRFASAVYLEASYVLAASVLSPFLHN